MNQYVHHFHVTNIIRIFVNLRVFVITMVQFANNYWIVKNMKVNKIVIMEMVETVYGMEHPVLYLVVVLMPIIIKIDVEIITINVIGYQPLIKIVLNVYLIHVKQNIKSDNARIFIVLMRNQ